MASSRRLPGLSRATSFLEVAPKPPVRSACGVSGLVIRGMRGAGRRTQSTAACRCRVDVECRTAPMSRRPAPHTGIWGSVSQRFRRRIGPACSARAKIGTSAPDPARNGRGRETRNPIRPTMPREAPRSDGTGRRISRGRGAGISQESQRLFCPRTQPGASLGCVPRGRLRSARYRCQQDGRDRPTADILPASDRMLFLSQPIS